MVTVTFEYDEQARKWDPVVRGAETEVEARQAFSAVVLTCQQLDPDLLKHAKTEKVDGESVRIYPAV